MYFAAIRRFVSRAGAAKRRADDALGLRRGARFLDQRLDAGLPGVRPPVLHDPSMEPGRPRRARFAVPKPVKGTIPARKPSAIWRMPVWYRTGGSMRCVLAAEHDLRLASSCRKAVLTVVAHVSALVPTSLVAQCEGERRGQVGRASASAMTGSAPISFNGAELGDRVSANTSCWFAQAMNQRPADRTAEPRALAHAGYRHRRAPGRSSSRRVATG